ncbi:MAG: hypothetical protein ACR2NW_00690 [Thermodesulfobacteriota bacterium]
MAISTLVVYEPLDSFGEQSEYWLEYSRFYEKYWGGPTSPFGVWFGNEYENYRKALSDHLILEDDEIKDCFFLKKGEDQYFIAPLSDSENIFSFENSIPLEWFVLFDQNERKNFFSHWGFNTIHYDASLDDAKKRLEKGGEIIRDVISSGIEIPFIGYLNYLNEGVDNLRGWLNKFTMSGFIVLNYGDICTFIHLLTLQSENSVEEIKNFLELLEKKKIEEADSVLRIFSQKWEDIRHKCEGELDSELLQ